MARNKLGLEWTDRVASIVGPDSRIFALCAPPGYHKTEVLRTIAGHTGALVICEMPPASDGAELARSVIDALVAKHRDRASRSAADRLMQRREHIDATSREALRREWPIDHGAELFVLYDPAGALASPAGADLFAELTSAFPASRRLAISTRATLPLALRHIIERELSTSLTVADLALTADDVLQLASASGVSERAATAAYDRTRGWPLACELLIGLLAHAPADGLLRAVNELPAEAVLSFAAHRTIATLDDPVREALIVTALLRGATHLNLIRVLGDRCDDAVFATLGGLAFIRQEGGVMSLHREVDALLRVRFAPAVKVLYERTLHVLSGEGAYADAADIALHANDVERAAALIDAAPPYTAASVPLRAYERVIERIDRDLITRFPNLWVATMPYRLFSVDRDTYVTEAETVYYCLPPGASPDQRAAVLMFLASAYVNVGRAEDASAVLSAGLGGFAASAGTPRASLLNLTASLHGIDGRFNAARACASEAAAMSRDQFGESQTLHYIECHEAAYRGVQDRVVVIVDELLRRRGREELPLYVSYVGISGAMFSWAAGDDDAFQRYITAVEDAMTPGLLAGFGPIIDAARRRPVRLDARYTWPVTAAISHLCMVATAETDSDALAAARLAAQSADERQDPFLQTLAHVAVYVLDADSHEREARVLEKVTAPVESPELHAAVQGLLAGESVGMLDAFITRRVRRQRKHAAPSLVVELLGGLVRRDGAPVRLTDKEFELLAFLALHQSLVSRDQIGEALWEHLDPEEWRNNFKVTLHRVRTKLATRDVVLMQEGRYRLAPTIDVDLRRVERLVRELRGAIVRYEVRAELEAIVRRFRDGALARYERYAWAYGLLARINEVVCNAGIALAEDARARGALDDAIDRARDVTVLDPFNERACETLIRAFIDRNDIDGARREYRRYASALANELGATPSNMLAALVRDHD